MRQRFLLDAVGWDQAEESAPHLATVHQAVWQDRRLHLASRIHPLAVRVAQTVAPYGLVAKAGIWHLVYAIKGSIRVQRVAGLLDARLADATFERPADFDLAAFWRGVVRGAGGEPGALPCHRAGCAELRAGAAEPLRRPRAGADRPRRSPDEEGWLKLQLPFESLEVARARLLGFGRGVEVLAPYALRRSIQDYAEQIVALYTR